MILNKGMLLLYHSDDIMLYCIIYSKHATLHEELLLKVNQKFLEVQQPMSVEVFNCFYEVCTP